MSLNDFWVLLQRWFLLILAPVFIAFNVLFALHFLRTPTYEAQLKLQVSVPQTEEVAINDRYRFSNLIDEVTTARNNFIDTLKDSATFDQAKAAYLKTKPSASALDYGLSVSPIRDADFVVLKFDAALPEEAVSIANFHTAAAIKRFGELRALPLRALQGNLLSQLEGSSARLSNAQQALNEFQQAQGYSSVQDELDLRENLIADLKTQSSSLLFSTEDVSEATERINAAIAQTRQEQAALLKLLPKFQVLQNAVFAEQQSSDLLQDKLSEANITASTVEGVTFIQVVKPATLPAQKLTPYLDYLPLAVVGSLGLGLLLAFFMTYLTASNSGLMAKNKENLRQEELSGGTYRGKLEAEVR